MLYCKPHRAAAWQPWRPNSGADRHVFVQAPDCKHGVASKIKVGVCAMDKKVGGSRVAAVATTALGLLDPGRGSSRSGSIKQHDTETHSSTCSCGAAKPAGTFGHLWACAHMSNTKPHRVTRCAQARSKPMCEILARLTAGGEFEVVTFGDQVRTVLAALRCAWACRCQPSTPPGASAGRSLVAGNRSHAQRN